MFNEGILCGGTIGVLFGCFARQIDGPGVLGGFIIYQGHLFPLKGHLWLGPFGERTPEGKVWGENNRNLFVSINGVGAFLAARLRNDEEPPPSMCSSALSNWRYLFAGFHLELKQVKQHPTTRTFMKCSNRQGFPYFPICNIFIIHCTCNKALDLHLRQPWFCACGQGPQASRVLSPGPRFVQALPDFGDAKAWLDANATCSRQVARKNPTKKRTDGIRRCAEMNMCNLFSFEGFKVNRFNHWTYLLILGDDNAHERSWGIFPRLRIIHFPSSWT